MKKKVLSLLTALCLMLSLVPAAFAAGTGVTTEDALRTAVASGGTVTLGADINLSSPLEINTAVVIDGTTTKYSITAPSGQNAINASVSGVEVKNLKINVSGNGYGVNSTGSSLTVTNCEISAVKRGISFYPANGAGAALTVTGTTIKNPNISNYDTSAQYGDYRAVATNNVKNGTVTISNSSLLGYGYSINALVANDSTGLRDGNGTVFNITNTTIKGWTALNMWSANTKFNFTNCTLVGINTLDGGMNGFSIIRANDGMYGGYTNKESVVTIKGGSMTAKQYGSALETAFTVDRELQTKFVFETYGLKKTPVDIQCYAPDGEASVFCFYPYVNIDEYLVKKVINLNSNATQTIGDIAAFGSTAAVLNDGEFDDPTEPEIVFAANHDGGGN